MAKTTEAERRHAHEQALANTRIEGHEPTAEFLADCEAAIAGRMSDDDVIARSLARALAKERAANGPVADAA